MLWWLPTFLISSFLRSTAAQSQASCLPFYSWASNSQNQSPCQVAASLLTVCNGSPFPVLSLPANSEYVGPTLQGANPCQCNTVTYSLMSACGACQGQDYVSWSVWTTNCATVYGNTFPEPIPSGVSVPGWAYLDVEAEDNFDQTNAKNNVNLTASTAVPSSTSSIVSTSTSTSVSTKSSKVVSPTTSHTSTVATSTTASISTATSTTAGSTNVSDTQANAIGGGIVGGLAGVTLLCGLLYWYLHRRRRATRNGVHLSSPTSSNNPPWGGQGPYMTQVVAPAVSDAPPSTSSVGNGMPYHQNSSAFDSADTIPAGHNHV